MKSKTWILWAALVAGIFAAHRLDKVLPSPPSPTPAPVNPSTLTPALLAFGQSMSSVKREDAVIVSDYYRSLATALAADPLAEPVVTSTAELRRAHRAGLLFLWRGMMNNSADKYPSLRSSIEGVLNEAIGSEDVPLNPAIREKAVEAFNQMAALCLNAKQ
jgi:hypothetical protein